MARWSKRPPLSDWCPYRGVVIPASEAHPAADKRLAKKGWKRVKCPVCGRAIRGRPGLPVQRHLRPGVEDPTRRDVTKPKSTWLK
jgi:hypothetical protein